MQTQRSGKGMCRPLYSTLCNFGLSHVGDQTTKTSPPAPNFVYSVIINQSPDVTVFWAQADKKKKMWRNYSGKRTGGKEKKGGCRGGAHRNRKKSGFRTHTHTLTSLWVFVRELLCVTDVSTRGMLRGRGTHVDEKRWLPTRIHVIWS